MKQFGVFLAPLRVNRLSRVVLALTPVLSLLMRLLIAVSVTRLVNWPVFTISVFNFAILFHLEFIIYFSPHENNLEHARMVLNEITFLILNYHLFLFTDYVNPLMYGNIANSVIVIFWISVAINVIFTVSSLVAKIKISLKQYYRKWIKKGSKPLTNKERL
jgi:hypothetical protein